MIMADVFTVVFAVVGIYLALLAYWLFFAAMCPRVVSIARQAYATQLRKCLLWGIAIAVPGTILGLTLANVPPAPVKLLGLGLVAALILLGQLGSAGLALHIGRRLAAKDSGHAYPDLLRGGTVLAFTFLFPGVGWFLVLPFTLISGVGAAALALRATRQQARSATPTAAPMANASS